jgi:hypothetical protein
MIGVHRSWGVTWVAWAVLGAVTAASGTALAMKKGKVYPTTTCASAKQQAAATYCGQVLKAWSKWEKNQDDAKRQGAVEKAANKLEEAWAKAEAKAASKGADCSDTTLASSTAGSFVDSVGGALVDGVNDGLDLGDKKQAQCGQKILKAAAAQCGALLKAESKFLKQTGKSSAAAKRDKAQDKARAKFSKSWSKATKNACPTNATESRVGEQVDAAVARLVRDTTASPSVSDTGFVTILPAPVTYEGRDLEAKCMDGSPYRYFAKRGTVNKLVMYYQGGGACWDQLTCGLPTCSDTATESDNPNGISSGFADLGNPDNPFRDWHIVFVTYCSCDVHFGDAAQDYDNFNPDAPLHVEHRGFQNAKIVEKWAREHFVNPERVLVTGSSAGAYGAWFHAPLLHGVWPDAQFAVLADAGNGVITQEFLDEFFPNWNFIGSVPPEFPEIVDIIEGDGGIPGYTEFVADEFPDTTWAHYTTSFDGGSGGQTGFYNLMLNDNNPADALTWWEGSCQFNAQMRLQAQDTAAAVPDNYRYYVGTGSRHTMWGANKVYDDTTGGVPTVVDWLSAMLASGNGLADPAWTNVECTNCGLLLPGDPRPNPLVAPFMQSGPDVVIDCPGTP